MTQAAGGIEQRGLPARYAGVQLTQHLELYGIGIRQGVQRQRRRKLEGI